MFESIVEGCYMQESCDKVSDLHVLIGLRVC